MENMRQRALGLARFYWGGDLWLRAGMFAPFLVIIFCGLPPSIYLQADDAFYYYQCAVNFWRHGFTTFDGVTPTNGVQPLWYVLNVVLAAPLVLLGRTDLMPHAAAALSALIALLSQQALYGMLRPLFRTRQLPAILSFGVCGASMYAFDGMEGTLSNGLVVLLLGYLLRCRIEQRALSVPGFALLAWLVLMARLDHGLLLLLFHGLALGFVPMRRVVAAGLLLVLFATPYFIYNHATQGHVEPISGKVKGFWAELRYLEEDGAVPHTLGAYQQSHFAHKQARAGWFEFVHESLKSADRVLLDALPVPDDHRQIERNGKYSAWAIALLGLLGLAWVPVLIATRRSAYPEGARLLLLGLACLDLFYAMQLAHYFIVQTSYYPWYAAAGHLALAAFIVPPLVLWIGLLNRKWQHVVVAHLVILWPITWAIEGTDNRDWLAENFERTTYQGLCLKLGQLAAEKTPADARLGSWTAGIVRWSSGRDTVNLEGLVEDGPFLDGARRFEVASQMVEKKVDFIVQHFPPDTLALNPVLRRPLDAFNDLRIRPLIDFPEAFQSIADAMNNWSQGWIWRVDRERLARLIDQEKNLHGKIEDHCRVIPAEDFDASTLAMQTISHRNTHGFAVTGKSLTYDIVGPQLIYARVLRPKPGDALIKLQPKTSPTEVHFEATGRWQIIRLLDVPVGAREAHFKLVIDDARRGFDPKSPEDRSIYLDEFYVLDATHETEAVGSFTEYDAFSNRIETQGSLSGVSPAPRS